MRLETKLNQRRRKKNVSQRKQTIFLELVQIFLHWWLFITEDDWVGFNSMKSSDHQLIMAFLLFFLLYRSQKFGDCLTFVGETRTNCLRQFGSLISTSSDDFILFVYLFFGSWAVNDDSWWALVIKYFCHHFMLTASKFGRNSKESLGSSKILNSSFQIPCDFSYQLLLFSYLYVVDSIGDFIIS